LYTEKGGSMQGLKKQGKGEKVVSLRVTKQLEQLLEEQAQEWNVSVSEALRTILGFYFNPIMYEKEWVQRVAEVEKLYREGKGEQSLTNLLKETRDYSEKLIEFTEKGIKSYEYLVGEAKRFIYFTLSELKRLDKSGEVLEFVGASEMEAILKEEGA